MNEVQTKAITWAISELNEKIEWTQDRLLLIQSENEDSWDDVRTQLADQLNDLKEMRRELYPLIK